MPGNQDDTSPNNWKTLAKGIRARYHEARKLRNNKPDIYYAIRFQMDKKRVQESLGWASEGWTKEKAEAMLHKLKEGARTGAAPARLKDKRKQEEEMRKAEEISRQQAVTVGEYWAQHYFPDAQRAEKPMTIKTEAHIYKNWVETRLGKIPLQALSPADILAIEKDAAAEGRPPLPRTCRTRWKNTGGFLKP